MRECVWLSFASDDQILQVLVDEHTPSARAGAVGNGMQQPKLAVKFMNSFS
jgi:hypothetical protein